MSIEHLSIASLGSFAESEILAKNSGFLSNVLQIFLNMLNPPLLKIGGIIAR